MSVPYHYFIRTMKFHMPSRPLCALAASAVLALTAPAAVRAQQPTATPGSSESDVFDIIKKGADKLQRQANQTKELSPKVKLLEERQNDLHKKMAELEQKLTKQQEVIDHLHKELEKLENAAKTAAPSPSTTETTKPGAPLPVTEPAIKPTPEASPSPSAS